MRKKTGLKKKSNTYYAFIFASIVLFLILVSLISKVLIVVRGSVYDANQRFNMAIFNNQSTKILSLSSNSKTASILNLGEKLDIKSLSNYLAIPIDATIKSDFLDTNQEVDNLFFQMALNYSKIETKMTIVDLVRIFILLKNIPEKNIAEDNITFGMNESMIDNIVSQLFKDEKIQKDQKTIQIINGTNISGLGNKLARLITNIGGDVILVATSEKVEKKSLIYYIGEQSYTVGRLAEILNFNLVNSSNLGIADVTIIIGEDSI